MKSQPRLTLEYVKTGDVKPHPKNIRTHTSTACGGVSRDNGHGKDNQLHPNQKPVELARRAIVNSTSEGEIVVDFFTGSGSTIIAAEQTGRICYALELDPQYVDVDVRRWQTVTGKQAIHATEQKTFDEISAIRADKQKAKAKAKEKA